MLRDDAKSQNDNKQELAKIRGGTQSVGERNVEKCRLGGWCVSDCERKYLRQYLECGDERERKYEQERRKT